MSIGNVTFQEWGVAEIVNERLKQDDKWGVQNHHQWKWQVIQDEESGEVAQAMLKIDEAYERKDAVDMEYWQNELRKELIQNAAVALARLEAAYRMGHVPTKVPTNWRGTEMEVVHGSAKPTYENSLIQFIERLAKESVRGPG